MLVRGASEAEVESAMQNAAWEPAKLERLQSHLNFEFDAWWYSRHYATKQVNPIFVEEENYIAVVTVRVYYF